MGLFVSLVDVLDELEEKEDSAVHSHPPVEVFEVCFDGALADPERVGDFFVAEAPADEDGDLRFPGGEVISLLEKHPLIIAFKYAFRPSEECAVFGLLFFLGGGH